MVVVHSTHRARRRRKRSELLLALGWGFGRERSLRGAVSEGLIQACTLLEAEHAARHSQDWLLVVVFACRLPRL